MEKPDAQLIAESLEGDAKAFEEIIRRYQRLVFNIAYHYLGRRGEVEDVAQEVFLKVYRSLGRFDTSRPFKAWIGRIASNACLDELRKRRTRKVNAFADLSQDEEERITRGQISSEAADALSEAEAQESLKLLYQAMDQLGEKDRLAFVLREMEGLEYSEVAQALSASEVAARIRVSRARKKLQSSVKSLMAQQGVAM